MVSRPFVSVGKIEYEKEHVLQHNYAGESKWIVQRLYKYKASDMEKDALNWQAEWEWQQKCRRALRRKIWHDRKLSIPARALMMWDTVRGGSSE